MKTEQVHFRCSPQFKQLLEARAAMLGCSMSALVEETVLAAGLEKFELAPAVPALLEQLHHISASLQQIVRLLETEPEPDAREKMESMLEDIQKTQRLMEEQAGQGFSQFLKIRKSRVVHEDVRFLLQSCPDTLSLLAKGR